MSLTTQKSARAQPASTGSAKKLSRAGEQQWGKLLDAAELVFADHGYDGTSLRDITEAAGVHLALSTYYFGTKERLFEEVIRRRAIELTTARQEALARINPDELTPSEHVRELIVAFVTPVLKASYQHSKQHQAYVRIMARIVNVKRWTPVIQQYYGASDETFIKCWRQAMPRAEETAVLTAMSFMVATLLCVCSYTHRLGNWPNTKAGHKKMVDHLIGYSHAGFMALEN